MNDIPQKTLRDILGQFGHEVCNDPKRCEALLNDLCPEHKREIRILVAALKEGIVADMMSSQGSVPLSMSIGRLAKRLHDNSGIAEQFALWSVESWAVALGLASAHDAGKLHFTCPRCNASGKASSKHAGKVVQCPRCRGAVRISPDGKNFTPESHGKPADAETYFKINDPDPARAEQLKEEAVNAAKSNKFETAIRLIEEAIRLNTSKALEDYGVIRAALYKLIGDEKPNQAIDMYGRGAKQKSKEGYMAAISSYEEAIALDPSFAWSYNNLAWLLSTAKNPSVHDGRRAIDLATKACELSNWSCWAFLGTLSAAYARAGDFAKAIEVGEASLRLFPDNHKPYHRVKLRGFKRGEAHIDEGEPVAGGKDPSEEWEAPQDGFNGNAETRYLSTEGFKKTRWGMNPKEVSNFYPDAVEDDDGDLIVEKKVAGEKSKIAFIFTGNLLWRVLIHQAYGVDGDSAASRFLHLYNTLKGKYGDTLDEGLNWHSQSQYNREDQSIWGLAIAAGHLSMFATWRTEETALFLTCQRQEMGGVFNSVDCRSIPIWEAIEQTNSAEHAGTEDTSSYQESHVGERVLEIVSEQMGVAKEQIARETSFVADLGVDSLDTVELVMELEEEFDITIPDEDAERIATVGQAIDYIEHRVN